MTDLEGLSDIYSAGTILAPQYKLEFFQTPDWQDDNKDFAAQYKQALEDRVKHYENSVYSCLSQAGGLHIAKPTSEIDLLLARDNRPIAPVSELTQYLKSDTVLMPPHEFWRDHEHRFPVLAALARDTLSVPATGAGVERLFNSARDICHYRRGSLQSSTIQDLMLLMCGIRFDLEEEQLAFIREYATESERELRQEEIDDRTQEDTLEISDSEEGLPQYNLKRRRSINEVIEEPVEEPVEEPMEELMEEPALEEEPDLPEQNTLRVSGRVRKRSSGSTDSDGQGDAAYETDLTEPDDTLRPPKRHRSIKSPSAPELGGPDGAEEIYDDPLDDTGIDLSEIPEDFDKAKGTIVRRERIESRWKRYCISRTRLEPKVQKWRNPEEALRQASNNDMYRFLGWCLKLERGEKGRHLKGIHKSSSLEADWKNLLRRGLKYLVHENGLDTQPAKKTPVYIEDIGPFNETILSTQEKKFHLGFQRIQFKDLQISLQKDPHGGPPVPLIELTAEGVKKFLGQTKLTTFALPEVIYGPSLVLCPHTLLFGILFHARAFRNPNLTSKAKLRSLFISKGCEQLLVPIHRDKADWYIFAKTELVKGVPTIQWTKPMSKAAMSSMLVTFGEIRGWKGAFHAHQFRYGSGKVVNESGWVSKEQHMLIMKHANPRTFLNHYHPLQLDTDMIRVICGLDPDVELMRAVTRQSRWRDTRRPRYLTKQQRAQVEDHSDMEEARRKLENARALYEESRQPNLLNRVRQREKELKNTRQRLLRALRQQVRENFDEEQAFLDIEAQLSGTAVKEDSEDEESSLQNDMHPLQLRLLQRLLSYPTSNSVEDEWKRRDDAVDAVVQYCGVHEGGPLRGRPKQIDAKSVPTTGSEPDFDGASDARDSLHENTRATLSPRDELFRATQNHLTDTSKKPRACFQCFANEKLPDKTRCKMFYDAGCVTRHFDSHHLHEDPLKCNYCEVFLLHRMAFQRHASDVHRVESRWRESFALSDR
ncbi:uncharacterized protein CDV56_102092 [Aspergillus thermomutatus]|uniref:C2H2-type domain-containing protein n=1 Tax=Aspergillus thermomutatus TaxID=41047 RepID=A0A397G2T2_ASPTH|nr:uncharacterized protein CDV56_102092 [Aspergillus thermomutatus]RHZ45341.1 hypothetical protein CDV56_102092 [Aspergillus thermomutatus]